MIMLYVGKKTDFGAEKVSNKRRVETMEIEVTDANFKQEVLESELPVLVDFWAAWCGPCQMVAPAIKEIATEYKGKLKVFYEGHLGACQARNSGAGHASGKYISFLPADAKLYPGVAISIHFHYTA